MLGGGLLFCLGLHALREWRATHSLLINLTHSLPNWAFLLEEDRMPARGDYIFFTPPQNALVRAHFGEKAPPFGKLVLGMPGDLVAHSGEVVTINGRPVATMKARTRLGEPLTPGRTGLVPQGCYYAGSAHKDGFDSRYAEIGFVCGTQVIGTGVPVL
ncbi:S26 family signal peptidase (plasmid) [Sphingobium baderi]|nr:S26 family signal peptidase [Sphingobium baderi]WRD78927.1 S26 family signal peptidase [Sphingobium baderi]